MPTPEQKVCPECGGSGIHTAEDLGGEGTKSFCPTCKGTGRATESPSPNPEEAD